MPFLVGVTCAALVGCESSSGSSSSGGNADAAAVGPGGGNDGGGGGGDGGGNDGGTSGCTITLTGGVNKTLPCTLSAAYVAQDDQSAFSLNSTVAPGAVPEAVFALTITGELQATTYAWGNSAEQSGAVNQPASKAWDVSLTGAKGSSSVTFSSVTTLTTIPDGKVYTVHGTVTATLQSLDQDPDIEMTVTF
jgi:hypothetical protein